ncbi:MAG: hypothetical protein WBM00_12780 [Solirubrobacterales bacterium]
MRPEPKDIFISLTASEALYEPDGGPLHKSKQPVSVVLGPFEYAELTYDGLRVGPHGDFIGRILENGVWEIDIDVIPDTGDWCGYSGPPDPVFSDVVFATAR